MIIQWKILFNDNQAFIKYADGHLPSRSYNIFNPLRHYVSGVFPPFSAASSASHSSTSLRHFSSLINLTFLQLWSRIHRFPADIFAVPFLFVLTLPEKSKDYYQNKRLNERTNLLVSFFVNCISLYATYSFCCSSCCEIILVLSFMSSMSSCR